MDKKKEVYKLILDNISKIVSVKKRKNELILIEIENKKYTVSIESSGENKYKVKIDEDAFIVTIDPESNAILINGIPYKAKLRPELVQSSNRSIPIPILKKVKKEGNAICSPITGRVIVVAVKEGDKVKKGDLIMIVESMKIRNEIVSDKDGVVIKLNVKPGDVVKKNDIIVELK